MLLLIKGQLRYLARTPGATLASVIATALGTMSVVAVHLLSEDIKAGLDVQGALPIPGYTHVVRGTDLTWDAYFDARDRWRQGHAPRVEAMMPLIAGQALVDGRTLRVLGVDMLADGYPGAPGPFNEDPSAGDSSRMLLGDGIVAGRSLGLAAGDIVRAGGIVVEVVAVAANAEDTVFADIPTALGILGRTGPSAILIRARGGEPAIERWFPGSTAAFDIGTAIELGQGLTARALDETEPTRRFALAILFNLGALGVLALFVAAFLIYQASYSNIARRRRERERLVAIGVGSGTLGLLFVAEGALIGLAGALIGTLLGTALAVFLTSMDSFALSTIAAAKGVLGGVGAGVIGAFAATRQATAQGRTGGPRWIVAGLAAALFAVSAMSDTLAAAFGLIFALCMAQFALLMPAIAAALRRVLGGRMGRVNLLVRANFRRFAALLGEVDIAASALSIAIAAAIGMGVQVENFRADFYKMLDQRLWRALYIQSERQVDIQWLRRLPGVTDVRSYGRTEALLNGRPITVTLAVGDALESRRYGYDAALEGNKRIGGASATGGGCSMVDERGRARSLQPGSARGYPSQEDSGARGYPSQEDSSARGYPSQEKTEAEGAGCGALEGNVMLSESGAVAHGLAVGASIEIEGPRGTRRVGVAHVFSDYGAPSPRVIGTFGNLESIFDGIAVDRTSVLTTGANTGALKRAIAQRYPNAHVRDQAQLRELAQAAFDRTFEVAENLTVIALVVAVAGLYNALSALVLRARDIHRLLYAAGVSRWSIASLAVQQNLLIGAVAAAAAVPLGLAIAYVLCAEVNPRAFGWSISFGIDVRALVTPILLGIAAALLAGVVPIWRGIRALGGAPEHALL